MATITRIMATQASSTTFLSTPGQGFDCSGLVFYSFDRLGVEDPLARDARRRLAAALY